MTLTEQQRIERRESIKTLLMGAIVMCGILLDVTTLKFAACVIVYSWVMRMEIP